MLVSLFVVAFSCAILQGAYGILCDLAPIGHSLGFPVQKNRMQMKKRTAIQQLQRLLMLLCSSFSLHLLAQAQPTPAMSAVSKANNEFGFKLYAQISGKDRSQNQFMSPMSVFAALAMTSEGLAGESLKTIRDAMGLPDEATLHAGLQALSKELNPADAAYAMALANAIWPEKSFTLQPEFLRTIETIYGGASVPQNYKASPEAARKTINAWVEQKTHDRIKDLIPAGALDVMTRMVLTNAIYFKGTWATVFNKESTMDQPFTLEDGQKVNVPLMFQPRLYTQYSEVDGVQALQLPYKGGALSMMILLPKQGKMAKLEEGLDAAYWARITETMRNQEVHVWLPRFKMELGGSIKPQLSAVGLAPLFVDADFSRMFKENVPFAISDVIHKAFVEVNEEGTEAAAATAVIVAETTSAGGERMIQNFRADHPFIFMIQHNASKSILFMGKVMNPN
jgi:serpin B